MENIKIWDYVTVKWTIIYGFGRYIRLRRWWLTVRIDLQKPYKYYTLKNCIKHDVQYPFDVSKNIPTIKIDWTIIEDFSDNEVMIYRRKWDWLSIKKCDFADIIDKYVSDNI